MLIITSRDAERQRVTIMSKFQADDLALRVQIAILAKLESISDNQP
jgi:hypothetical protein